MEFSFRTLVIIVLGVLTLAIILGIFGTLSGSANSQLGSFFGFIGNLNP